MLGVRSATAIREFWNHCFQQEEWAHHPAKFDAGIAAESHLARASQQQFSLGSILLWWCAFFGTTVSERVRACPTCQGFVTVQWPQDLSPSLYTLMERSFIQIANTMSGPWAASLQLERP